MSLTRTLLKPWLTGLLGNDSRAADDCLSATADLDVSVAFDATGMASNLFAAAFDAFAANGAGPTRSGTRGAFAESALIQLLAAILVDSESPRAAKKRSVVQMLRRNQTTHGAKAVVQASIAPHPPPSARRHETARVLRRVNTKSINEDQANVPVLTVEDGSGHAVAIPTTSKPVVDLYELPPPAALSFGASFDGGLAMSENTLGSGAESISMDQLPMSVRQTTQADCDGFDSDGDSDICPAPNHASQGSLGDVNQYVLMKKLGQGTQGTVYLAVDTETEDIRAIKAVKRPAQGQRVNAAKRKALESLAREVAIMKKLRHRSLITLHEVIDDPAQDTMFLVMQYVEHGPMATMLPNGTASRTYDAVKMVGIALQICAGLQYLHRHGVIHRDIKPENILLGANDHVYLADFGVSEAFDEAAGTGAAGAAAIRDRHRVTGTRGTPAFLAPELLAVRIARDTAQGDAITSSPDALEASRKADSDGVAGEPVDVWALGITLYVLLYGRLPWEYTDAVDLFDAIQRRPIELRPQALASGNGGTPGSFVCHSVPSSPATNPSTSPGMQTLDAEPHSSSIKPMLEFADPGGDETNSPAQPSSDTDQLRSTSICPTRRPFVKSNPSFLTSQQLSSVTGWDMSSTSFVGGAVACADEAWRRLLCDMLQRDPKRRATLSDVRKRLEALERRVESSRSFANDTAPASPSTVFVQRR